MEWQRRMITISDILSPNQIDLDPKFAKQEENGIRLCIPHIRTNSIKMMVMGVGRSEIEPESAAPNKTPTVQYTFVIGVPNAMASDYLRIIGALARIFKDKATEAQLRATKRPEEFLAILTHKEMVL